MEDSERRAIRPPRIALLCLIAGAAAQWWISPDRWVPDSPYHVVEIALLVAGFWMMLRAVRLFDRLGTSHKCRQEPTRLVTSGPYRVSRNPMYLGMVMILLAVGLHYGTIPMLLVPVAFLVTMEIGFIPAEERILERIFGEEYEAYRSRVRRWL